MRRTIELIAATLLVSFLHGWEAVSSGRTQVALAPGCAGLALSLAF
jgi:hypothetical protein